MVSVNHSHETDDLSLVRNEEVSEAALESSGRETFSHYVSNRGGDNMGGFIRNLLEFVIRLDYEVVIIIDKGSVGQLALI